MKKNDAHQLVVLQVLPELDQGGVERGTVEIAEFLAGRGIKNFVASQGGRLAGGLKRAGVKHFALPLKTKNPLKLWLNSKKLEKIIRENGVNVVHARSRAPAWSAYWAAKRCGARFVTTFHGTYGLGPWGIKKFYNRVMTFGERVIAISAHIGEHILEHYGTDKGKIRQIARCVDTAKFDPKAVSHERIISMMKENALPEHKRIVLLVGRLTRWKGQGLLVDAAALLAPEDKKDLHCVFLGDDQGRDYYTDELKRKIRAAGLDGRFSFIRHLSDVPAIMMVSDIVLSASTDPEAFGRVAIEGQAMGKIVVASDIGGSKETIIDGKTGRLFASGSAESLSDALEWALRLPEARKSKIAAAAMKNVRDNYTRELMCGKTLKVYEEVLSNS